MRRLLLPALLVAVAVGAGVLAFQAVPAGSGAAVARSSAAAAAPVLTARRVPVLLATPIGDRRLRAGLEALVERLPQPSCLEVSDAGRQLYESAPDVPVIPASTLKLVTAATVLTHLDATDRLRTSVRAGAAVADGVLPGDLWLVGGGDPLLGTQAWATTTAGASAVHTPMEALADQVVAAGIRSVQGRVVGDESRYDALRVVPSWPARYGTQVGPLSALTVNDGYQSEGARAPFPDPPSGAAGVLTALLRERGVEVVGEPAAGTVPTEGPTEVGAVDSPTVLELVGQMLRESDNGTAELLLKEVGLRAAGDGSTAAGAAVAEATLADLGLPMEAVDVVDGSGLDRSNSVTCELLHDLLVHVEAGGQVEDGLAVAGTSGTLSQRFLDSPVSGRLRAKTGTLNGVAGLAGYADTSNGGEITFAFVLNGLGVPSDPTPIQRELAELLVAHPDVPAIEELGPRAWPGLAPPG